MAKYQVGDLCIFDFGNTLVYGSIVDAYEDIEDSDRERFIHDAGGMANPRMADKVLDLMVKSTPKEPKYRFTCDSGQQAKLHPVVNGIGSESTIIFVARPDLSELTNILGR